jgi:hypothetical protein
LQAIRLSLGEYVQAREQLSELADCLNLYRSRVPAATLRHTLSAIVTLGRGTKKVPRQEILQKARNHLLVVRELLGDAYDDIPVPDKLIRHCDNALKGTPGEGDQSQVPYG